MPDPAPGFVRDLDRGYPADPAAVDRVRPVILSAYRSAAAGPAPATGRIGRPLRPVVSFALAAAVLAGGAGIVAANSGPGDYFYPLRLAAESISLPFLGEATTPIDRMQHRLDEARGESGDPAGVSAALEAYRAELQRALAEARTTAEREAFLGTLDVHSLVLDELAGDVPDTAGTGLQQAIDQVGAARDELRVTPSDEPSPPATPNRGDKPAESHGPPAR